MDAQALAPGARLVATSRCDTHPSSPESFVFEFLHALQEQDIEVVKVGPRRQNVLQVTLNIRFSA
jgi:hypothetical protein